MAYKCKVPSSPSGRSRLLPLPGFLLVSELALGITGGPPVFCLLALGPGLSGAVVFPMAEAWDLFPTNFGDLFPQLGDLFPQTVSYTHLTLPTILLV